MPGASAPSEDSSHGSDEGWSPSSSATSAAMLNALQARFPMPAIEDDRNSHGYPKTIGKAEHLVIVTDRGPWDRARTCGPANTEVARLDHAARNSRVRERTMGIAAKIGTRDAATYRGDRLNAIAVLTSCIAWLRRRLYFGLSLGRRRKRILLEREPARSTHSAKLTA